MKYASLFILSMLMSSCAVYNKHFDCSAPSGIPCRSVTEVESLIVENEEGPDLYEPTLKKGENVFCEELKIRDLTKTKLKSKDIISNGVSYFDTERGETILKKPKSIGRIWIHGYTTSDGSYVEGRYIYFTLEDDSWIILNK